MSSSPITDETSNSILSQTGRYLWRHRNKIAAGGVIVAAGVAIYSYISIQNDLEKEKLLLESGRREKSPFKPENRLRMLLKIRKQFDFAMKQFLPTMRMKILEVVDISTAIRKIKELKMSASNETKTGIYIHVSVYAYIYMYIYIYIYTYIDKSIYIYIYIYIYLYICIYMYMYVHIYIYIYVHIYIHTHI
jgi:hypothetical protein